MRLAYLPLSLAGIGGAAQPLRSNGAGRDPRNPGKPVPKGLPEGAVLQEKAAPDKKKNLPEKLSQGFYLFALCKIGNACAENVLAGVFVFACNAFYGNVFD